MLLKLHWRMCTKIHLAAFFAAFLPAYICLAPYASASAAGTTLARFLGGLGVPKSKSCSISFFLRLLDFLGEGSGELTSSSVPSS